MHDLAPLVLVVEDSVDTAEMYREALDDHGLRVAIEGTGPGALSAARDLQPAVMILDVGLPEIDGLEVLRRLRSAPETAQIPVIAATGQVSLTTIGDLYREGCEAVLIKPVSLPELRHAVRDALGRHHRA
ncbi:MAG: response regulator [Myxococcota bacterium]|nr:response regulator [Myxococcota bacterium]